MQLLRVFYWDIYVAYKRNPKAAELVKYTRKEKLLFDFFCLVIEFHTVSRDVAFYAKKMCVRQASYNGNYRYERSFGKRLDYRLLPS